MGRTCGPVLGADVEDAVGVDVERDIDLRHAARRRREARQLELAQQVVVARARALALVHLRRRVMSTKYVDHPMHRSLILAQQVVVARARALALVHLRRRVPFITFPYLQP